MTEEINLTRTEVYLAKLCGAEVTIPEPVTRGEMYLAKLCGMDIDIPSPVTRGEMYLAKLCGMEVDIPSPITRLEMYMAAACGLDIDIQTPEPITRIEQYWAIYLSTVAFTQEYTGALPIAITAHRQALLDYRIYGNSVQDGTPTPEEPVEVVSVGDKTANLIPAVNLENGWVDGYLQNDIGSIVLDTFNAYQERTSPFIKIDKSANYAFSSAFIDETQISPWYGWLLYDNDKKPIGSRHSNHGQSGGVIHPTDNAEYIRISLRTHGKQLEHVQLQLGTQATSYEPFGYKIPVTVSGENGEEATTNIYLDEPLRKIGDYADYVDFEKQQLIKNVAVVTFTGEEEWRVQGNAYFTYIAHTPSETPPTLCSAFSLSTSGSTAVGEYRLAGIDSWNGNVLFNYDDGADGVDNFKSYVVSAQ